MNRHTSVLALTLGLFVSSIPPAHCDTFGILTAQIQASGASASGVGTWANQDYNFFGTTINANVLIGDTSFSSTSDISQTPMPFNGTVASVTPGTLSFSFSGTLNATVTELLSGNPTYQVAFVDGASLSTTLSLPSDVSYVVDGKSTCVADCNTASPTFEEVAVINGFQAQATPTGSVIEATVEASFYDPNTLTTRTISPTITFDSVDAAGDTTVTASSSSAAQFSFGFELLPNPIFFDVSTTATHSGPITICTQYADTNPDDGIVDGTSVLETDLMMMHGEGANHDTFVDRTLRPIDTVNNIICAQVDSLSPFFVAAVTTTTTTTTTSSTTTTTLASDTMISGKQLRLRWNGANPSRTSANMASHSDAITVVGINPTISGASIRMRSLVGAFDTTYSLPAGNWTVVGSPLAPKGYRYRDKNATSGPIKSAKIALHSLLFSGAGSALGYTLGTNPSPIDLDISIGATRFCASFDGIVSFTSQKSFAARNAPQPSSCIP